jgi:hypothetical protein
VDEGERLFRCFNGGGADPFEIGRVPSEIARHYGTSTRLVRMRVQYARKILAKHRLSYAEINLIPLALEFGWVGADRGDMAFLYGDPLFQRGYALVLKCLPKRNEYWLRTFHRAEPDDFRRLMRRHNQCLLVAYEQRGG